MTLLLCSHLALPRGESLKPLSPKEWAGLAVDLRNRRLRPGALLGPELIGQLSLAPELIQRVGRLLARGVQLAVELERLGSLGIWALTRADAEYPRSLKERLRQAAPPVLFGAGPLELLGQGMLAVVGSRDLDEESAQFARQAGGACGRGGFTLVSGGARGADQLAMGGALESGGTGIAVLADSLEKVLRGAEVRRQVAAGQLVLVTAVHPRTPFNVTNAMARNRLIYCLARFGLVVASAAGKGGTWSGATEVLKERWVPLFVRGGDGVPDGNQALLSQGALPYPAEALESDLISVLEERSRSWSGRPEAERRSPAEPPAPGDGIADLFQVVWPHIALRLAQWPSARSLAEHLHVEEGQMRAWLERAVESGLAEAGEGVDEYRLAAAANQAQSRLDL